MIVIKIALAWLLLDAIACAGWSLMRRHQRARERQSGELTRMIETGGASDFIPFHANGDTDA